MGTNIRRRRDTSDILKEAKLEGKDGDMQEKEIELSPKSDAVQQAQAQQPAVNAAPLVAQPANAPPALAVAAPPAVAAAPIAQAAPITANAQVQAADKNGESANGEAAKVGDELTKKIDGIEKELDTAIEDQNKQTVAGGVK